MTNYLEEKLIDHLFRTTAYSHTSPVAWYIGLHTGAFGESGTGGVEVPTSATNYVRIAVTRGTGGTHWVRASDGNTRTVHNGAVITFGIPSGNWGQVTHVGIWDSASATTNLIIEAQLEFVKNINNGDPAPKFNIGELKFTFD